MSEKKTWTMWWFSWNWLKKRKASQSKDIVNPANNYSSSNAENPVNVQIKNKLSTGQKVKLLREKRDLQKAIDDRLKDKSRKKTERENRDEMTIASDKLKNT